MASRREEGAKGGAQQSVLTRRSVEETLARKGNGKQ